MRDENYIHIAGWMVNKLGLTGAPLLVYASLYGFTQDGHSEYQGSLSYIDDWLSRIVTKRTVIDTLKALEKRGLIIVVRHDHNQPNSYRCRTPFELVQTLPSGGSAIFSKGSEETSPVGSEETSPHKPIYKPIREKRNLLKKKEFFEFLKEKGLRPKGESLRQWVNDASGTTHNPLGLCSTIAQANGWKVRDFDDSDEIPGATSEDIEYLMEVTNYYQIGNPYISTIQQILNDFRPGKLTFRQVFDIRIGGKK